MMVLYHFDWSGTKEELEEFYEYQMKIMDKTEGAEFIGKFAPLNKAYHFTWFAKFKDLATFQSVAFAEEHDFDRIPHAVFDIYSPEQ